MGGDLDYYRRIFDRSDDLQAAAAIRAVFDVDVEDPFEQSGPTHARRFVIQQMLFQSSHRMILVARANRSGGIVTPIFLAV